MKIKYIVGQKYPIAIHLTLEVVSGELIGYLDNLTKGKKPVFAYLNSDKSYRYCTAKFSQETIFTEDEIRIETSLVMDEVSDTLNGLIEKVNVAYELRKRGL